MKKQKLLEKAIKTSDLNKAMQHVFAYIQQECAFGFDADAAAGAWQMIPVLL